jgi:hypothetical protein
LQLTDAITIDAEADSLFDEVSKQQAALQMLIKISELIEGNNTEHLG